MLRFCHVMGGGILNSCTENIGDLSHRMSEKLTFGTAGYEFVKVKVEKTLHWVTNPYGLDREFQENIVNNARYLKKDVDEYRKEVYAALEDYAKAHEKLPTYNRAQSLAKLAAVSLGHRKFNVTARCLEELQSHLGSRDEWIKFAHEGLE